MGIRIPLEPLTHEAFAAFGSVLEYDPNQKRHRVVKANQGSADKVLDVSVMADAYAAKAPSRKPGRPVWNLFYARQRALRPLAGSHVVYDLEAVERHPYTTQTFVPLARRADEVAYVVVVSSADPRASNWAQLAAQGQVRAFYARGSKCSLSPAPALTMQTRQLRTAPGRGIRP